MCSVHPRSSAFSLACEDSPKEVVYFSFQSSNSPSYLEIALQLSDVSWFRGFTGSYHLFLRAAMSSLRSSISGKPPAKASFACCRSRTLSMQPIILLFRILMS